MANYKKLICWQKADNLALLVYKLTGSFPKNEAFGMTSQLRRASLSVPVNIVEGYNRNSKKELARFLNISLGSLAETEYLLCFAEKLGYVSKDLEEVKKLIDDVGKLLWKFREAVNKTDDG